MIVVLTENQMLRLWRQGARLEPAVADGTFESLDGLLFDDILRTAMRAWYLRLLHEADPGLLRVNNTAVTTQLKALTPGRWELDLPVDTVRLVGLALKDRGLPVRLLDSRDPDDQAEIRALPNRFRRGGPNGTAVRGENGRWTLWYTGSDEEAPKLAYCHTIDDFGDESYILDERLLADIPQLAVKALEITNEPL